MSSVAEKEPTSSEKQEQSAAGGTDTLLRVDNGYIGHKSVVIKQKEQRDGQEVR